MAWLRGRRGRREATAYDAAFMAVYDRVEGYRVAANPELVLAADAVKDAATLWRAAHADRREQQHLDPARHLLGWFHGLRFTLLPTGEGWADLAQSLLLLGPFTPSAPDTIPAMFDPLIGARAEPDAQVGVARGLLEHAMEHLDPAAAGVAVALLLGAVTATPPGHAARATRLSDLGVAYHFRFDLSGGVADLDAAVEYGRQSVAAARADDPDRELYQHRLDAATRAGITRSATSARPDPAVARVSHLAVVPGPDSAGIAAQLDAAIEQVLLQELSGPPDDMAAWQGVAASLDADIDMAARALDAAHADDADRVERLMNLAIAYQVRFERARTMTDLDAAIDLFTAALAATSELSPDRPVCLAYLCRAHHRRYLAAGPALDRAGLLELAEHVRQMPWQPPVLLVPAAAAAAGLARALGEADVAVTLFQQAVQALPGIARRELERLDQENQLGGFTGLVGEAVAAHLDVGDAAGAIETAELGRGVLLSAQLDVRADVTELRRDHPELAEQLERLRDQFQSVPTEGDAPAGRVRVARGWQRDTEWRRLPAEIRQLDGFEQFLAPSSAIELTRAATGGSVVMINVAEHRADALLLRPGAAAPMAVPLDRLTLMDVHAQAVDLLQAGAGGLAGSLALQRVVPDLLAWLWETVAEPVLTALGHPAPPAQGAPWPRVWWVPTGLVGVLPLHAAGLPSGASVLDRVVSSYAPTIRTLGHARRRRPGARRQLTVAMHRTPGQVDLPGAVAEAAALHARYPEARLLADGDATGDRVLTALRDATWAHFACHTAGDSTAPGRGGLLLHDGPLPITDIAQLALQDAELAYLSACSTAQTGWQVPDEAVHLASAFQLAGFRHVIATLWPLDDAIAARAAHRFHELLPATADADAAATALHQVTRELRDLHPDRPDRWAPLIHSGP